MYICICNAYSDKDIKQAVETYGHSEVEKVYCSLGDGLCCGKCEEAAQDVIDDTLFSAAMAVAAE